MGIVIGQRSTRRARARRTKVALGGVAGWAMVALMTAMGPMFAAPDPAVARDVVLQRAADRERHDVAVAPASPVVATGPPGQQDRELALPGPPRRSSAAGPYEPVEGLSLVTTTTTRRPIRSPGAASNMPVTSVPVTSVPVSSVPVSSVPVSSVPVSSVPVTSAPPPSPPRSEQSG